MNTGRFSRFTTSALLLSLSTIGLHGCLGGGSSTSDRAPIAGGAAPESVNLNDGRERDTLSQAERDMEFIRQYNENRDQIAWNDGQGGAPRTNASTDLPMHSSDDIAFTQQRSQVRPANPNFNPAPKANAGADESTNQKALAQNPPIELKPIEKPEPAASTPEIPAASLSSEDRLDQLMVDLTRELRRQAAYADSPLGDHLTAAALSMVDPDRVIPPENLYDLTDRERAIFGEFQTFFASLGEAIRNGSEDIDAIMMANLDSLREKLRQEPPLSISEAQLCIRVKGFGDFTPYSVNRFLAMGEQRAIVYLELDNYLSEQTTDNLWKTELSQELSIYADHDGLLVWNEPWQRVVDTSKRQRSDFFTAQIIQFPKALTVGKYYLKIRLRDETSGALAEHSIPFEMVADPTMVGK